MDTRTLVWQKKDQFMMWGNKKERRKKHAVRNNNATKKTQKLKRNKTQKMPTAVLRGDSQSGLAANAPIRSALSWPFYLSWSELFWRVLDRGALLRACICQAPAIVPNSGIRVLGGSWKANSLIRNCLLRYNTNWFFVDNMVLPNQFHTEYHRVTLSHTKTPIPWGFLVVESPKTA